MQVFATAQDLAARWHALTGAELTRAGVLLSDVSVYLKARLDYSGIVLESENETQVELLKIICCDVVKRVMLAPGDTAPVSSMQQGAGAYQGTLTFANPSGDKYLTADEMRLLGIKKKRQVVGALLPQIGGD